MALERNSKILKTHNSSLNEEIINTEEAAEDKASGGLVGISISESFPIYLTPYNDYYIMPNNSPDAPIFALAGNDIVYGNDYDNYIYGQEGNDWLYGKNGNDTLSGDEGDDYVDGGNGNDLIIGGIGNDILSGRNGNDTLNGGKGSDLIYGHDGDDIIRVSDRNLGDYDYNWAGNGFDVLDFTNSDAAVWITGGNKYYHTYPYFEYGGEFDSVEKIVGSSFRDNFIMGAEDNIIDAGAGDDSVRGEGGNDYFYEGLGTDYYSGGDGSDTIDTSNLKEGVSATMTVDDNVFAVTYGSWYLGVTSGWFSSVSSKLFVGALSIPSPTPTFTESNDMHSIENFVGTDYNDQLRLNSEENHVWMGGGDDYVVHLLNGNTTPPTGDLYIDMGDGNDIIDIHPTPNAHYEIYGGAGNDHFDTLSIWAGSFSGFFDGGDGDDFMLVSGALHGSVSTSHPTYIGGAGNDVFQVNAGQQEMFGGDGDDYFVFTGNFATNQNNAKHYVTSGSGNDVIMINSTGSFMEAGTDKIIITDFDTDMSDGDYDVISFKSLVIPTLGTLFPKTNLSGQPTGSYVDGTNVDLGDLNIFTASNGLDTKIQYYSDFGSLNTITIENFTDINLLMSGAYFEFI